MEKKLIPLATKQDYFCAEDGTIYNAKGLALSGYLHQSYSAQAGYSDKYYRRYTFQMKDGTEKKFYGQRLTAMCYHKLRPEQIVRHLSPDSLNNHKDAVLPGTQLDNQTIDRIEHGTYMNRGGGISGKQHDEDVGF